MAATLRPPGRRPLAALACGLAVVLFVALNTWADRSLRSLRLDLTEDGAYTVSEGTRAVLASIREPIVLRLYASAGLDALGPDYAALEKRTGELLGEYRRMSGGLLRVERFDPQAFSPEEDMAVADGVQGVPNLLDDTRLFLGLSGTNSTDGRYTIPHLAPERAAFLEYDLTRMVHDLATPEKPRVALIGDLPLAGDRVARARPWAVLEAAERFFDVTQLFGDIRRIDDDIDILWLAEPGALGEATLYAIDRFVMRGGRVLAFLDPFSETLAAARAGAPGRPPRPPGPTGPETLAPLLEAWGVDIPARTVVGDRAGALKVQATRGANVVVTDYPVWFEVGRGALAADDPATGTLALLQFRSAGHIRAREGATTTVGPLVRAGPEAAEIDVARIEYAPDPAAILADFAPTGERYTLAARVTGPVRSAFPDGPPDAAGDEAGDGAPLAEHGAGAAAPLALILVADADMLADEAWVDNRGPPGQPVAAPFANNGDLVVNLLDALAGSDAMIGLRGRGVSDRRFVVLDEMARRAESQYRAKERELRRRIDELQREIDGLGAGGAATGAARQAAIREARDDMLDLRRELREVRFALRKDVADLKARLTALNIWAVPAAIGLFAVGFALRRAWRNRAFRRAGA